MAQNPPLIGSTDVAIVGAGPIGLELAVALKLAGRETLHFDAQQIGHTISWWPRNTSFFSTSERIAISGVPMQNTVQDRVTGEAYLAYLRGVVEQFGLQVNSYERVVDIVPSGEGFALSTHCLSGENRCYRCRRVVLATGDMDRPHRLGIPGEDLAHVTHYFTDPHRYFQKRLLVVGGRNSAVEAALRCWRAGARVTLSYRRAMFNRGFVKGSILPDLKTQIRVGNIGFLPETVPLAIRPCSVVLGRMQDGELGPGEQLEHETDFVLLCTGFEADLSLFERAGITLTGRERIPVYEPQTMETDVPGIYVAGTAASGNQVRYNLFIENCHEHVQRIVVAITGCPPKRLGTIPARKYSVPLKDIQAN